METHLWGSIGGTIDIYKVIYIDVNGWYTMLFV